MSDPVIKAKVLQMLNYQAEVALRASASDDGERVDRFGIPDFSLLSESDDERAERVALVERLVKEVVDLAIMHLGRDEASKLFKNAYRAESKGKQPSHEAEILRCYDAFLEKHGPSRVLVGVVVDELRRRDLEREPKSRHFAGNRAATIRRVGRAVNARTARNEAARRQHDEFRTAYKEITGCYPETSFLEKVITPNDEMDL
jgi:hypothetical protein